MFTSLSGSGNSSLVFGTITAESQRRINETYSASGQGLMPTLARPEVDVLEGLTTAIIVEQLRLELRLGVRLWQQGYAGDRVRRNALLPESDPGLC
jgi:hypothetical protein